MAASDAARGGMDVAGPSLAGVAAVGAISRPLRCLAASISRGRDTDPAGGPVSRPDAVSVPGAAFPGCLPVPCGASSTAWRSVAPLHGEGSGAPRAGAAAAAGMAASSAIGISGRAGPPPPERSPWRGNGPASDLFSRPGGRDRRALPGAGSALLGDEVDRPFGCAAPDDGKTPACRDTVPAAALSHWSARRSGGSPPGAVVLSGASPGSARAGVPIGSMPCSGSVPTAGKISVAAMSRGSASSSMNAAKPGPVEWTTGTWRGRGGAVWLSGTIIMQVVRSGSWSCENNPALVTSSLRLCGFLGRNRNNSRY
jgi:hypothetical protein